MGVSFLLMFLQVLKGKEKRPVFFMCFEIDWIDMIMLLLFRLELISMDTFVGLSRLERFLNSSFSLSSPIFAVAFNLQKFLFIFVAMLLLLSFIFDRLKLSSNAITTLEFGAFNHLINIQKVLDFLMTTVMVMIMVMMMVIICAGGLA